MKVIFIPENKCKTSILNNSPNIQMKYWVEVKLIMKFCMLM